MHKKSYKNITHIKKEIMEIKTITCHNAYNYGASLQAYALQHFLQSLGHNVQIIDFLPYYFQTRYNLHYISPTSKYYKICHLHPFLTYSLNFIKSKYLDKTWGRKRNFDNFTKQFLTLTENRYETSIVLKENPPQADIYIAGSDQIWNTDMNNGKEPAYYLDFGDSKSKRISYAASFGISKIESNIKEFVRQNLYKFDSISVREQTGIKILQELGIKGELVLDPVFLLNKQEWQKLSQASLKYANIKNNHYILVYDFTNDERTKQMAYKIKAETNLPIVSINDYTPMDYADININNAGPLEFINLINNASTIVSNSFHATAFSIILEKEFYVYPLKGQNNSSRMTDLLNILEIIDRFNTQNPQKKLEYNRIKTILDKHIQESKSFLKYNLNNEIPTI